MRKLLATVAMVGMLAVPGLAEAQTIGGAIGYHDDFEAIGIGAYGAIPLPQLNENISINPSFIYYFPDGFDAFEINGDLVYQFAVSDDAPVVPFALAGLNIIRVSVSAFGVSASSTDVGLNLGGGITFRAASVTPFAGAKFELQDGTGFLIFGGLGFPIGG